MKSKVSMFLILIFIILLFVLGFYGFKIGNFKISSISQIIEKNDNLNEKVYEINTLTAQTYPENIDKLKDTFDRYEVQKKKYEELSLFTDEDAFETKQYDISYLWRVIGKHATNRGLKLGINVNKSIMGNNAYDFSFEFSGEYTEISQFIVDIENDSDLYFRIYDFKLESHPEKEDILICSLTVRNINLDPSTVV